MNVTRAEVMSCLRSIVVGAVIAGALGYLSYLPSLFVDGDATYAASSRGIAMGVTLVSARAGAVVGLIYFLIRRQLIQPSSPPAS